LLGFRIAKYHVPTQNRSSELTPGGVSIFLRRMGRSRNFLAAWDSTTLYYRPLRGASWSKIDNVASMAANADHIYYAYPTVSEDSVFRIAPTGVKEKLKVPGLKGEYIRLIAHDSVLMVFTVNYVADRYRTTIHLSTNRGDTFRRIDASNIDLPEGWHYLDYWEARYLKGSLFVLPITGFTGLQYNLWTYDETTGAWSTYDSGLPEKATTISILRDTLLAGVGTKGLYWRNIQPIYAASGKVFIDANGNKILDTGEQPVSKVGVRSVLAQGAFFSDLDGTFTSATDFPVDTHLVLVPNPKIVATPARFVTNKTNIKQDIALQLPANERDMSVSINASDVFRPGFETKVRMVLRNELAKQENVVLRLTYEPGKIRYLNAAPAPTFADTLTGVLRWSAASLAALSDTAFALTFRTKVTTPLGVLVNLTGVAEGAPDVTPEDNTAQINSTVVGSFDPNDKLVSKALVPILNPARPERLAYTIRFQNTGSFQTAFINLFDTLDAGRFDLSSLEIIRASHPFTARIIDQNILKVTFADAVLPPQSQSETASQGFFSFSLRTKKPLDAPDVIRNRAGIYFDYNPVVLTDYATTKVDFVISTGEPPEGIPVAVSPNPAAEGVFITLPADWTGQDVRVTAFSASGQVLFGANLTDQDRFVSLKTCPPGLVLLQLECAKGKAWAKVVKQP
jgi:hypothetical protein